jgi:hypothetical protein
MLKLTEFLKAHKTAKKGDFTHTKIGDKDLRIVGGSYCISENDENEFYTKYFESVFVDENDEYLTERQMKEGQMVVDLDFRYSRDIKDRQHTSQNINEIVVCYLEVFNIFHMFFLLLFSITFAKV